MVSFTQFRYIYFYREEIEKQKAHERYMRLQEQGKTEQARKDLGDSFEIESSLSFVFLV